MAGQGDGEGGGGNYDSFFANVVHSKFAGDKWADSFGSEGRTFGFEISQSVFTLAGREAVELSASKIAGTQGMAPRR